MKDYPLILSLDTATKCSTISLTRGTLRDGEVLASLSLSSDITHSRRLINSVDILFKETRTDWINVAAVAVGLGPGSFTGLRIGITTAKGFVSSSQKKLLGVSTLDALAAMCTTEKRICAVIDARKKQIYSAYYTISEEDGLKRLTDIRVINPEQLITEIDEPVLMVGDGVKAFGEYWKAELGSLVTFAQNQLHTPSASAIGFLCGDLLQKNMCLDIASASPIYVRASDAELSLANKKA